MTRKPSLQDAVLAFMADPASHDPAPDAVHRIDTHAAIVFLAGDLAYKIKRAVRLPYLDFSTLDKRRAVCERELEINRISAPGIYLAVVAIVRREDGSLSIGGKGEPVEWAVKMRRFDQSKLLDRLAQAGDLPLGLMSRLAETVADLHGKARRARAFDCAGAMAGDVVEPVAAALGRASPHLDEAEAAAFTRALKTELKTQTGLLNERAKNGFVRRCHGDLHLRNIVLIDNAPVLFDAIEFDEAIATIDILYDLAFLLMDLRHRGLDVHANVLFNAYMRRPDAGGPLAALGGLALLPLFLACRAGVRAMVSLDRLQFVRGKDRNDALDELREFFDLARGFLHPPAPRLVAVGGFSGTGKSTLAAGLAAGLGNAPGALVVRSDVERKRLAGAGETQKLGPEHYTAAATGRVYRALYAKAKAALAAGHTVLLDAVFAREHERNRAEDIAREAGVPFTGLWLEAPERELIKRVGARDGDASDADAAVVRKQLGYETGEINWRKVDASGAPESVHRRARKMLAGKGSRT